MPEEAIEALAVDPDGIYVDCTLGGAGHSSLIAARLSERGRLIGLDQDAEAIEAASARLAPFKCRVDIVNKNFKYLAEVLASLGAQAVDGVLFDLGVSSHQIDTAERGFSYMHDAPLDMRMDRSAALSAHTVINEYAEEELTRIFYEYGEERWAKRVAKFIAEARREKPIETTGELVRIIEHAIPRAAREKGGHPAKRVFQAVRIEVNDELGILAGAMKAAVAALKPGGRLAVITFHSLEDRIVKQTLKDMSRGCICPPQLPVCVCGHKPEIKLLGKPKTADKKELKDNTRARSAKLRVAQKL